MRYVLSIACLCGFLIASVFADDDAWRPIIGPREEVHIEKALHLLHMSRHDLGFEKDVGEPHFVFDHIRYMLRHPLDVTALGDDLLRALDDREALWNQLFRLMEVPHAIHPSPPNRPDLSPLDRFLAATTEVQELLNVAYRELDGKERAYVAGSVLGAWLKLEDRETDRLLLTRAGVPEFLVEQLVEEGRSIDPEPAATRLLNALDRIDYAALLQAGRLWHQALTDLADAASSFEPWPDDLPRRIPSEWGWIIFGTLGDDVIEEPALLVLNPGGDNTYRGGAGVANGLLGHPLSAIIDLSGNDTYRGDAVLGPGAALFGLSFILDRAGNDVYRAEHAGQGAGLIGIGWLEDHGGNDVFEAGFLAQGAGVAGLGVLDSRMGDNLYRVGVAGQGFAGVRAVGLLLDHQGNDVYVAGGREPDHERHPTRYLSLAQGASIGVRPFAGGGYGLLIDRAGNDSYVAEVYGQGVGYWYAVGMLLDLAGNDTYTVHHYGQGTGIHLSLGLLFDAAGDDKYTGYILTQGSAHDYGVGLLVDHTGDDTYTADHYAQGRAIYNSVALLLDVEGNDAYLARQPDEAQGMGHDGWLREYPSAGLLLDLGGKDIYSCDATNGVRLIRPDVGIVYDLLEAEDEP